ncbi:hypothetical protein [Bdellovibrio sp. NC01]|uniref:hypothetical protein n=1 Tax=Bdellovibrio sp. NC01 TaxID=2220073 RepID=UPI0011579A42|nr:hypothetical protein [Bdellovibrio sp. NC01]QDK39079.1 hypothetical protein DOE51_16530 [Bdellovibrio sp. NC01]
MKKLILALFATVLVSGTAKASEDYWTQVVSYTTTEDSPAYRDILVHNPGTYSEMRVQMSGAGYIDRIDTISLFLWGKEVDGLDGHYEAGEMKAVYFGSRQVRWIRLYARSAPPGMPVNVKIWMR